MPINPRPVIIHEFPPEAGEVFVPPQPPPRPPRMRLARQWRVWLVVVAVLAVMGVGGAATRVHTIPGAATANPTAVAKYRERVKADEELKQQETQAAKTAAVKTTCVAMLSAFDRFEKLNAHVWAFNNGGDINSTKGPAINSLNSQADAIIRSFSNGVGAAQPPLDHRLFQEYADALRATAAAVNDGAAPDDFNATIDKMNDYHAKVIRPCVAVGLK